MLRDENKDDNFLKNFKDSMKECYPKCKGEYIDFDTYMCSIFSNMAKKAVELKL